MIYRQATRALALARKFYPRGSPDLWTSLITAAYATLLKGQYPESEALAREAIEAAGPTPSPADARWQTARGYLGLTLAGQGKASEARPLIEESLRSLPLEERPSRFRELLKAGGRASMKDGITNESST